MELKKRLKNGFNLCKYAKYLGLTNRNSSPKALHQPRCR